MYYDSMLIFKLYYFKIILSCFHVTVYWNSVGFHFCFVGSVVIHCTVKLFFLVLATTTGRQQPPLSWVMSALIKIFRRWVNFKGHPPVCAKYWNNYWELTVEIIDHPLYHHTNAVLGCCVMSLYARIFTPLLTFIYS